MTDQSIFNDEPKQNNADVGQPPQPAPSSQSDGLDHLLSAIKNEQGSKKYSSVEDALKGAAHAQEVISKNKSELDQLRSEITKLREENAEYKGAVSAMQTLNPPSQPEPESLPAQVSEGDGVSQEELIERLLAKKEQEKLQESNISMVAKTLQDKFGEKATEVFYGKATELGLTQQQINLLAAQSPKAVLAYFGSEQVGNINPTKTSASTAVFGQGDQVDFNKPLPRTDKSMMLGVSSEDLRAEMQRHKERVYAKYGISQ